jgi:hypothetical protein
MITLFSYPERRSRDVHFGSVADLAAPLELVRFVPKRTSVLKQEF